MTTSNATVTRSNQRDKIT